MGKFCILGAVGDCRAKIKKVAESFNTSVQRNVARTLVNISQSTGLVSSTNQTIKISNITCKGDFTMGPITQKTVNKVNMQKLSEVVNKEKLKEILTNAVKTTAESDIDVKSGFLSTGADVSDINRTYNNNINETINNYTYNNFQSSITKANVTQNIIIGGSDERIVFEGNCSFDSVSQEISLEVVAIDIAKSLTDKFREIMLKNQSELESKATIESEATGPIGEVGDIVGDVTDTIALPFYVALGVIGLIFFIIIALIIYYGFVPATPENTNVAADNQT